MIIPDRNIPYNRASRWSEVLALLTILLLAAALRFPATGFGLPSRDLVGDEGTTSRLVSTVLYGNTLDTRNYKWPNVNVYASAATIAGWERVSIWLGRAKPDDFVVGRSWVAASGVLTVLFLYLAALRLTTREVAWIAASLLAVMPLHVERSRVWLTDAPMTMFYTLTLWLAARAVAKPSLLRLALAGASAGLATGTKYNGAIACVLPAIAALLAWRSGRARLGAIGLRLSITALIALALFFVGNPYALRDFDLVRAHLKFIGDIYTYEPSGGFLGYHVMREVARVMFAWGIGGTISILAVFGFALWLFRRGSAALLIWLPPVLYVLVFCANLRYPMERNFLPTLPHVAIAAATALAALLRGIEAFVARRWRGARVARSLAIGTVLALIPAAFADVFAVLQSDTRLEAAEWFGDHVPLGARATYEFPAQRLPRDLYHVVKPGGPIYGASFESLVDGVDYMVLTSFFADSTLAQRRRPGFAPRVALYEAIFRGDHFERAARFAPGLDAYGPEVYIYRNLRSRWPEADPETCFDVLAADAIVAAKSWRPPRAGDRLGLTDTTWIGGAVIPASGRWQLRLLVNTDSPLAEHPIEAQLGGRARRYWAVGETLITHEAELTAGEVWFRVGPGRSLCETTAWLHALELCPVAGATSPPVARPQPPVDASGLIELGLHAATRTWSLDQSRIDVVPDRIVAMNLSWDSWMLADERALLVIRNPGKEPYQPGIELHGHPGSNYPLEVVLDDGYDERRLTVDSRAPRRFALPVQPPGTTTAYELRSGRGSAPGNGDDRELVVRVGPGPVEELGTGFRAIELSHDGWTGEERPALLLLENPSPTATIVPTLLVDSPAPADLYPLHVFVDQDHGRVAHRFTAPGQERIRLDPLGPGARAVVFVRTDKVWRPGGGDPRALGVRVGVQFGRGD